MQKREHIGPRGVREPVHKWITYSPREQEIIDTPLFQRLRYVSQLTSANNVFPGGDHSRFVHSLGAMHLAGLYMRSIIDNSVAYLPADCLLIKHQNKYIQMARLAGLTHDIGHGPFSHAFDWSIYQQIYNVEDGGHDKHRFLIIRDPSIAPLVKNCGVQPEEIIAIWDSHSPEYLAFTAEEKDIFDIIRAVVQGPLGADRMDFTLRDSHFTGTEHIGTIAYDRIISKAFVKYHEARLCLHYDVKALSDIVQALDGRFHMYDTVYFHKTVSAASIIISRMMKYAADDMDLIAKTKDLQRFVYLNDHYVMGTITNWIFLDPHTISDGQKKAAKYCHDLLNRKLPKMIFEAKVSDAVEYKESNYLTTINNNRISKTSDVEIMRTRSISGIDPRKFDRHRVYFYNAKDKRTMTCQQALDAYGYHVSEPYYYVRAYELCE